MESAFEAMRRHARNHNLGLVDVAGSIIDKNLAPGALTSPPAGTGA